MILLLSAAHTLGTQFLADGGDSPSDVNSTTGHGPEWGEAAPIGLLVIVLMCIGVYFLVKSLNRNLKKVPDSFDEVPVSVGATSDESAESANSAAEPDPPKVDPAKADPGRPGPSG